MIIIVLGFHLLALKVLIHEAYIAPIKYHVPFPFTAQQLFERSVHYCKSPVEISHLGDDTSTVSLGGGSRWAGFGPGLKTVSVPISTK